MRKIGRPREWGEDEARAVQRLVRAGLSYREIAVRMGVTLGKVQRMVTAEGECNG